MIVRKVIVGVVLAALALVAGCAGHQRTELPVERYRSVMKQERFVPVNVELEQYFDGNLIDTSNAGIAIDLFRTSGLFAEVGSGSPYTPYNIRLKFNRKFEDGELLRFGKAMLTAGTLGIVPASLDLRYDLLAEVRTKNDIMTSFRYSVATSRTISIFVRESAGQVDHACLEELLGHLFQDLVNDKPLPTVGSDFQNEEKRRI